MKYFHKYRKHVDPAFAEAFTLYLNGIEQLLEELKQVRYAGDLNAARGQLFSIEGRAAAQYWNLFGLLLKGHADFTGRERRGATDLVNSLLNYGYAILHSRVYLALIKAGLSPQISYLHTVQKGKPTLVFDLMEEFRPQVVDRTVLTMLSRREKVETDTEGLLTQETRRRFVTLLQDRLSTLIRFRKRELKADEIILQQAQSIVRHLRDQESYRPFVGKW